MSGVEHGREEKDCGRGGGEGGGAGWRVEGGGRGRVEAGGGSGWRVEGRVCVHGAYGTWYCMSVHGVLQDMAL